MDENSRKNDNTESADDQKEKKTKADSQVELARSKHALGDKPEVLNPREPVVGAAGPSSFLYPVISKKRSNNTERGERQPECRRAHTGGDPLAPVRGLVGPPRSTETGNPSVFSVPNSGMVSPPLRGEQETKRGSVGPPPSYSFVMKQKKKLKPVPSPDPLIINRPPPPNYTGNRGFYMTPEERAFGFPSFAEPIWRSHSQPALCPRCGILVLTTTHSHESIATHVAALALCLFGCWPCCLLPYCMNVCKNTFHYCPICQTFLGLYTPW